MDELHDWAGQRVLLYLCEHSGRTSKSIRSGEALTQFNIDMLDDLEFIIDLEEELGTEIPDPKTPFQTVGDIVAFVRQATQ